MFLRTSSSAFNAPRRGIALLVTIILLSFLVLLMVALSSLVRVETKVAANQDTLAQARQNALMGLNIALAKLQETAGPDIRLTARADLLENAIPVGSRYQMNLTGVWDPNSTLWPNPITWLINGNEDLRGNAPTLDPASSQSGVHSKSSTGANTLIFDANDDSNTSTGHPIHSAASLRRYDDAEPPAKTFTPPSKGVFHFGDGHVYLVGNGSLDIDPDAAAPNPPGPIAGNSYKHAIDERVIVRKSPIIVDGGKLAGRDPGTPANPTSYTVGNYAYWVGDAGIKASLSAANQYDKITHDDSTGAGDGSDYEVSSNSAADVDYIARKLINGMQLQGNRYDLLFRSEPGANDIFASGDHPPFLSVTSANRTPFYGAVMHTENADLLLRLQQGAQLPYVAQTLLNNPTIVIANRPDYEVVIAHRLKQLFHDVTPQTFGVLTNMRNGGLRYDLSYLSRAKYKNAADYTSAVTAMPGTTAVDIGMTNLINGLETYANIWRPSKVALGAGSEPEGPTKVELLQLKVPIVPPRAGEFTQTAGSTSYPMVPVITELSTIGTFAAAPGSAATPGQLNLTVAGELELWNPYNVSMSFPNTQSLQFSILIVDAAGAMALQDITVLEPATSVSSQVSLARTLGWDGTMPPLGTPLYLPIALTAVGTGGAANRVWTPGSITKWSFALPDLTAIRNSGSPSIGYTPGTTSFRINTPGTPNTVLSVKLQLKQGAAENDLYSVMGVDLGNVATPTNANRFQYYFRLNEDSDYPAANPWLKSMNPMGPEIQARVAAPFTYTVGAIIGSAPAAPSLDSPPIGSLLLLNESTASATPVVLFDVPRQDLVGIGSLRHLVVNPAASTQAYAIGAKNAGNPNNVFEDFFFSTVPGNQAAWALKSGDPLPDTSMVVFDPSPGGNTDLNVLWRDAPPPIGTKLTGIQSENSAQYLLVKGAFNINSTSLPAWRAFLGGALPTLADPILAAPNGDDYLWTSPDISANWRYFDGTNDPTQPLRNSFFRYPQTASDLRTNYLAWKTNLASGVVNVRRRAAYRVGVRELTNDQVDELAWNVVDLIKTHGQPYVSVKEFINTGVIQDAIDRVGTTAYGGPVNSRINQFIAGGLLPEASPAFLSQGDILELIGHRLFARSDTFIIRVYGDVTEPTLFTEGSAVNHEVPKVTSRVWLEATVQRTPIKHPTADDPDDNMKPTYDGTGSEVGNFGRQFRILNIRWLRPDEV